MKILIALALPVLGVMAATSTASAQVQLTMQGGRVTLSAKNATIRQILAEWERVGQTKVVNGERTPGGLVTLELPNMPEQQALDIVLRSASGVLFAPRTQVVAGDVSAYSQIILMPPSVAPPPSAATTPPAFPQQGNYPQQTFQPPLFQPPPGIDDDDRPTVAQPRPVFVFPQPQIPGSGSPQAVPQGGGMAQPQPQQMPPSGFPQQGTPMNPPAAAFPGAPTSAPPAGVAVPGMVMPVPAPQPGQPGFVPQPQPQPQPALQRTNP